MKMNIVLFVFVLSFVSFSSCKDLIFKFCDRQQSNFNECLINSANDALKQLQTSIPELDLPSFNPLNVTNSILPAMKGAHWSFEAAPMEYLLFYGFDAARINNFVVFFNSKTINVDCFLPKLTLLLIITFKGILFSQNVEVRQRLIEKYDNAVYNLTLKYEEEIRNEKEYIKVVESQLQWTFENPSVVVDEEYSYKHDNISKWLDEHLDQLFENSLPDFESKVFAKIFANYFDTLFRKFTFKELFG